VLICRSEMLSSAARAGLLVAGTLVGRAGTIDFPFVTTVLAFVLFFLKHIHTTHTAAIGFTTSLPRPFEGRDADQLAVDLPAGLLLFLNDPLRATKGPCLASAIGTILTFRAVTRATACLRYCGISGNRCLIGIVLVQLHRVCCPQVRCQTQRECAG